MKKILIIAYDFPPYVSVGGLRPFSWYKYLKEYGVEPIVLTRQWENKYGNKLDYIAPSKCKDTIIEKTEFGTIYRTPHKPNLSNKLLLKYGEKNFRFLRKIISGFIEVFQWFLPIGTKYKLYKEANKYLKNNNVDVIIATGIPFILFRYANNLSKKYNIPWIADYRDLWSQHQRSNNVILEKLNVYNEKKYLKNVSEITTVSSFLTEKIKLILKVSKYNIIPNGYIPENFENISIIKQNTKKLTISLAGYIYPWHPIESFLFVCNKFVEQNNVEKEIELNFYGINNPSEIDELVKLKYKNLINVLRIHPKIPNLELLKKMAESNLLLLFNYYSYMGTKIYDYMALKRQILFCYSNDNEANLLKEKYYTISEIDTESSHLQEDLITQTNSGIIVKDTNHLLETLNDLYMQFKENGEIKCNSTNTEQFSRKIQAKKLAELIKQITI